MRSEGSRRPMRSVGVVNMTWNLRSKIKVLNECDRRKFTKTTQVYNKRGNQTEKRSFGKEKKSKGERLAQFTQTGGCVTKKGRNQARSESKSPVCVYTHTAYVGWCTGGPPRSHLIVQCEQTERTVIGWNDCNAC
jgi:hypothetical protein